MPVTGESDHVFRTPRAPGSSPSAHRRADAQWWGFAFLPLAALALVVGLDAVLHDREWRLSVTGLLDEPAHFATAWLILAAFLPHRARALAPWALAGSVLIDLDHVPFYLWGALDAGGGRPATHSLATVVVLLLAGLVARSRARTALLGLGLGVALHLLRDLATGPGIPLLWPVSSSFVLLPYLAYLAPLGLVAALATARRLLGAAERVGVGPAWRPIGSE